MVILGMASPSPVSKPGLGNQYLNPDDGSNEIDAKSSPLAMLAKTCSQIGADSSNILNGTKPRSNLGSKSSNSPSLSKSSGKSSVSPRPESGSDIRITDYKLKDPIQRLPATTSSLSPIPSHLKSNISDTSKPKNSSPDHIRKSPANQPSGLVSSKGHHAIGTVCRDLLCRDPTCPTFMRSQQLLAAASGSLSVPSPRPVAPQVNFSSMSDVYTAILQREALLQSHLMAGAGLGSPHRAPVVCNWVSGSEYCGRRFSNSEELQLHLKTHTNMSLPSPTSMLLPPSNPSRYHPYSRPPSSLPSQISPPLGIPPGYLNPYAHLYPGLFPRPTLL